MSRSASECSAKRWYRTVLFSEHLVRINLQWNKQDQAVTGSKTDLRLASVTGYVSDEFIMRCVSDVTFMHICRCLYSLVFGNNASDALTLSVFRSLIIAVLSIREFRSSGIRRCITGWSVPHVEGTLRVHPQGSRIPRPAELKTLEYEGNTFLRTVFNRLSNDATSHTTRADSSVSPPWILRNPSLDSYCKLNEDWSEFVEFL